MSNLLSRLDAAVELKIYTEQEPCKHDIREVGKNKSTKFMSETTAKNLRRQLLDYSTARKACVRAETYEEEA